MSYTFLEHTADVKFLVETDSVENMFIDSAMALKDTICGNIEIAEEETREIEITGNNLENLMYKFLEEFLIILDSEHFLPSKIKEISVDIDEYKIKAKISGDKADKYDFTSDVKAITYSEMFIEKRENGKWYSQAVLDV